nr:stage II sporulation protein M [Brevibacillus fulvus]
MKEHQSLYLFTIVLFAMGVVFGAFIVNSLAATQKQELISFLQYFFKQFDQHGITDPRQYFQQSSLFYLKTVGVMWLLGLSIIGLPFILLVLFVKGVIIGFTVGFLVNQLAWQGISFSLFGVLPQNMLIVPALVMIGVGGIAFSLRLLKTGLLVKRELILPYFFRYTFLVVSMMGVLLIAVLFETFVSPQLMQYVLK